MFTFRQFLRSNMNTIRQRKGFESRIYTLDPESDFVEVEYKSLKEKVKFRIHLMEVGNDIQYEADNLIVGKILFVFLALISTGCIAYLIFENPEEPGVYAVNAVVWGGIALIGLVVPNKDDLIIANGSKLVKLFRNKPGQEEALAFANFLIARANKKKKEALINFDLNEDQFYANVFWLHQMNLIDKTEFAELQSEYSLKKLI